MAMFFFLSSLVLTSCFKKSESVTVATTTQPPPAKIELEQSPPPIVAELTKRQTAKQREPRRIRRGSYTVWSVPLKPSRGESYAVHLRVKLPPSILSYSASDLSGSLEGGDGYEQVINAPEGMEEQKLLFVPGSGFAELIFEMPGAQIGNNDTLVVSSKILKESKKILINFK